MSLGTFHHPSYSIYSFLFTVFESSDIGVVCLSYVLSSDTGVVCLSYVFCQSPDWDNKEAFLRLHNDDIHTYADVMNALQNETLQVQIKTLSNLSRVHKHYDVCIYTHLKGNVCIFRKR